MDLGLGLGLAWTRIYGTVSDPPWIGDLHTVILGKNMQDLQVCYQDRHGLFRNYKGQLGKICVVKGNWVYSGIS